MIDSLMTLYPWIKAFHIMAVISWMAGMFYLPRLFVYHAERAPVGSELDQTFQIMEAKLMKVIMGPAMMASWVFGLLMLMMGGFDFTAAWAWIKLAAVIAMTVTHVWLSRCRRDFATGQNMKDGRYFRILNEVPTVLMFVIVIAVVVRPF